MQQFFFLNFDFKTNSARGTKNGVSAPNSVKKGPTEQGMDQQELKIVFLDQTIPSFWPIRWQNWGVQPTPLYIKGHLFFV